jgi:uncharacterized protein involved in exopolysaccharide biosynthesis
MMASQSSIGADIGQFFRVVVANWKRLLACAGVFTLLAALYTFVAPKWYESTMQVMPAAADQSGGLLGAAASLMGNVGIDLPGGPSADSDKIDEVLQSRSVTDAVIEKFGLIQRYQLFGFMRPSIERTRKKLWDHCKTEVDRKSGAVALTCEDRDPVQAQKMTEYMGEVANNVFRRISAGAAGEQRRFLEVRVAQVRKDLDAASQKLREFQETHKVIDLGAQSSAVVAEMAALQGDIISKQMQLGYMKTFSTADEASAVQLRQQIALSQQKLQSMQEGQAANAKPLPRHERDASGGVFPVIKDVPKLRFQLEELFREQKIQETLFLLLTQQYEMAKISEARNASQFQILDSPPVASKPARPDPTVAIPAGLVIGLFLGVGWILVSRRRWSAT